MILEQLKTLREKENDDDEPESDRVTTINQKTTRKKRKYCLLSEVGAVKWQHSCGAPSQHELFYFLFTNQGVTLKTAAQQLHKDYQNLRKAKSRLYRRENLYLVCPLCFTPSLRNLLCESCGFEGDKPSLEIESRTNFKTQNPVHSIQPLGGIGSKTDYEKLHLAYVGTNIKHLVENKTRDPLLEGCKSLLWEELKLYMPPDRISEETVRILTKEVKQFEAKYPDLINSHKIRKRLVLNVLSLLSLRFPKLFFRKEEKV